MRGTKWYKRTTVGPRKVASLEGMASRERDLDGDHCIRNDIADGKKQGKLSFVIESKCKPEPYCFQ